MSQAPLSHADGFGGTGFVQLRIAAPSSVNVPFTALHTFFISPTGSDAANGLTPATAWLTPNHAGLVCGDVLVAAAGAYSSASFDSQSHGSSLWGTVGTCPSTTGGIDGLGGVYFTTVVCATYNGCTINASTTFAMEVDKSNWAIEGFQATNTIDGSGACFHAQPIASASPIAFVAFINNVAANCPLVGFGSDGFGGSLSSSVDEFAVVGNIAFNTATSGDFCGSSFGANVPVNVNALAGTHIYFAQNFGFASINSPCSENSIGKGGYTTMASSASAGASTISVAGVSGWGINWPIAASGGGGTFPTSSAAIVTTGATPTLVSSVSGTTIGLSNNVAAPGLANSQLLSIGTSTDGEGLIFDSWGINPYTGQGVAENNIFWKNGGHGMEVFCSGSGCTNGLNVIFNQNTVYCDAQDYKHDGPVFEINDNTSGTIAWSITNNLVQQCVTKPANSQTFAAWNGTTGVGGSGTGQPAVAAGFGHNGFTVTGNYFASAAGATCPSGATCDGTNSVANFGSSYGAGNTLGTSPGFAAPGSAPTTFTNCTGFANSVACMAPVIADFVSSAAPTKGYQAPGACTPNANYPTYLKGIVFLRWDGAAFTEDAGLVTKPCGL